MVKSALRCTALQDKAPCNINMLQRIALLTGEKTQHVFLNNFCRFPDSCHREEGKNSRELFAKVRAKAVLFCISGFGWVVRPLIIRGLQKVSAERGFAGLF